jgi:uncharacterized protein
MKVARHDRTSSSPLPLAGEGPGVRVSRLTRRRLPLLAWLALATLLAGCASRPAEHFYTVSVQSAASDPGTEAQRFVVSPIVIPALIDRPQLIVRTGGHEIAVLENHRWAEPLSVDLTRALVTDLRRLWPTLDIVAAPTPPDRESEPILDVAISELITGPGPSTSLQATWDLHDRARRCSDEGSFGALIPTQAGDNAIPAAYAEAMSRLAEAIAKTISVSHTCASG